MPVIFNRPVLVKDVYVPSFSGISTFAHLPYLQCWEEAANEDYDIAIIGAPYDIGVTFRTGARFGPSGIREGSKRIKVRVERVCVSSGWFFFNVELQKLGLQ